jgi:hypothetical protein
MLLLCLWPTRAPALEELQLELGLHNRFTLRRNGIERLLRYSEALQAFDGPGYHRAAVDETYYSFLASAGIYLEPTRWLGLGLQLDSGEVNPTGRLPREGTVQLSSALASVFEDPPVLTTEDRRLVTASGQPIGQEARSTAFVRQAFLQLSAPETAWLTARAGRVATDVGSSLIYDDFGLGGRIVADLERLRDWPLRLSAKALLPTRSWTKGLRSPLVELKVDYVFSSLLSLVEAVGLTFAYFHDGDNNMGQLFLPFIAEAAVRSQDSRDPALHRDLFGIALATEMPSRGDIFWVGVDGNKLIGDLMITGTVLLEVGSLSLENPFFPLFRELPPDRAPGFIPRAERVELSTLGVAVDLVLRYLITEQISLGAFVLYLSGEQNPFLSGDGLGRYTSFLGVVPYITHTNLFLSGGMNESFSGRNATTAGINGRGVVAAGATFAWDIIEDLSCGSTAAVLLAPVESMTGGKLYGVEVDLEGSYTLFERLKLSLEYDLLATGSFFPGGGVIHKLLVGLDLTYEL